MARTKIHLGVAAFVGGMMVMHSQQPHLPRNRVAFERNGLERRKARHVLGREYHAEASRGHVLQVQVVTAAVPKAGRFLGEIRPLDLRGDVASGAHDFLWPPEIGRRVAALVPGAQFELMEEAGHFPHLQAPQTLARLARWFLDN